MTEMNDEVIGLERASGTLINVSLGVVKANADAVGDADAKSRSRLENRASCLWILSSTAFRKAETSCGRPERSCSIAATAWISSPASASGVGVGELLEDASRRPKGCL
jgi:hypothetical protein